jgi:hypothetical protein
MNLGLLSMMNASTHVTEESHPQSHPNQNSSDVRSLTLVSVRCVPALRIDSEVIVTFRLGCWFDGVRQSGGDVPREEFLDAVDGVIGDASQHLV